MFMISLTTLLERKQPFYDGNSACGSAQVYFLTISFTVISISDIIYKIKIEGIRVGV